LEQTVQGGGGVPIPGGVKKTCRCGTSGHGLVGLVVLGWQLDLMVLEVFSNLWFYMYAYISIYFGMYIYIKIYMCEPSSLLMSSRELKVHHVFDAHAAALELRT